MAATRRNPALTDREREQIVALHRRGLGCREIARNIGRSAGAVSRAAASMGCTFDVAGTRRATAARVAVCDLRRMEREGAAWDRVAAELDRFDGSTSPAVAVVAARRIARLVDQAVRAGRKG